MNNAEQETGTTQDKAPLSFAARIIPSIFSATGIGLVLGLLISMDTTGVDGENGYAVLYNTPIMILFVFSALMFIGNKRAHIVFAIISALIWLVSLIGINYF